MIELFTNLPFIKIGWMLFQFLWISSLLIAGTALVLKLLKDFTSRLKYAVAMGVLLMMGVIPALLTVKHSGDLRPIGLADWGSPEEVAENPRQPIFEDLPQIGSLNLSSEMDSMYYWVGIGWMVGSFTLLCYYLISAFLLNLKCRQLSEFDDDYVRDQIKKLALRLGISKDILLREVSSQESPAVTGLIHPFVLLPVSLADNYKDEELKALLLHELIHIKRRDYLFSIFQRVLGSLFFVQPLILWLNKYIDREREHVCDEMVTALTQDSYLYARTLVKLNRKTHPAQGAVLGIAQNDLVGRIRRLVEEEVSPKTLLIRFSYSLLAICVTLATLFCTFWNSYHLHF